MPSTSRPAITHADLAPKPQGFNLSSKTGVLLTVLCIICGLLCFILSLLAEATRSEVTWVMTNNRISKGTKGKGEYECMYSESGKLPLICASVAFVTLGIATLVQHSFLLVGMSKSTLPMFVSWETESSRPINSLSWQAGFFFISTWICFAVAEILLLIGLSVESGHLNEWSKPRPTCLIIREGVFTSAGIFSLFSVFLAAGLYATALRLQWLCHLQETVRRDVLNVASLYVSPPRSPRPRDSTPQIHNPPDDARRQNPTVLRPSSLYQYFPGSPPGSYKQDSLV